MEIGSAVSFCEEPAALMTGGSATNGVLLKEWNTEPL